MNSVDLHMHSHYSDDGDFSPAELARMCHKAGIRVMAVTDHNCVKANDEAQAEAERLGIRYIPGIEMDCVYRDVQLHLLGYAIDHHSPDFAAVEENVRRQSARASRRMLELTQKLGFAPTESELDALSDHGYWKGLWTGEMFAEVLLGKPEYRDDERLRPYRPGGARDDNPYVNFYWDYYSQGKACYAEMTYPGLAEAIALVKGNGGKAVLAHPGVNLRNRFSLLDEMIPLGLDGLEAFSSYHDEMTARYLHERARVHSLIVTCGSDFHGKTKPSIHLGESGCFLETKEMERQL